MFNPRVQDDQIELSLTAATNLDRPGGGLYVRPNPNVAIPAHGGPLAPKIWRGRTTVGGLFANNSLWDKIFVLSCVVAVLLDPLFFYIPVIQENNKCLGKDKHLGITSLLLRSLTDITFIVNIIFQIREHIKATSTLQTTVPSNIRRVVASDVETGPNLNSGSEGEEFMQFVKEIARKFSQIKKTIAQKMPWLSLPIFIDFLAVLPIPQVLILVVFFSMRGSGYLDNRKILGVFLLGQYVPRIYRIHLSSKEFTKTSGIWVKGAFNFFLYILASHVLGAFWYFFSIQRETSCWSRACKEYSKGYKECMNTFYCNDPNITSRNITFLKERCPLDSSDNAPFNFGIFLDSLKSGNAGEIPFLKKLLYSFWWGLRNLSNFGTNLITSNYVWENCFAILISIIGLLLFLYLIGNVQTLMQLSTTRTEEIRQKIQMKELDIQVWMERNALPDEMKKEIIKNIRKKLEEDKDANLEDLYSILPWKTRKSLKRFLCMETLKKVPKLRKMKEPVLKMICDYLKPVMYAENSFIVRTEEPLDLMFFITQGTVWSYTIRESSHGVPVGGQLARASPSAIHKTLEKGDFYGDQELLSWASIPGNTFSDLPISTENVKCHTKVEGFALSAKDLSSVAAKCKIYWDFGSSEQREEVARSTISTAIHRFRRRSDQKIQNPRPPAVAAQHSPSRPITYVKPAAVNRP